MRIHLLRVLGSALIVSGADDLGIGVLAALAPWITFVSVDPDTPIAGTLIVGAVLLVGGAVLRRKARPRSDVSRSAV
jgi:hypothetical protein